MPEKPLECDFCSSPNITRSYLANSFSFPELGWHSVGHWAACDDCAKLIDGEMWDALAQKSTFVFADSPSQRIWLKPLMLKLHKQFNLNRIRKFNQHGESQAEAN